MGGVGTYWTPTERRLPNISAAALAQHISEEFLGQSWSIDWRHKTNEGPEEGDKSEKGEEIAVAILATNGAPCMSR
jgi:hypothetical protein